MRNVLTEPEHVTPEWLTAVLRDKGHLDQGRVERVTVQTARDTPASTIARLAVEYAGSQRPAAPLQFFLKLSRVDAPAVSTARGRKEVAFYDRIAGAMPDAPAPRCFDALYSRETRKFHLLLEDLSASHFQAPWPLPPLEPHCEQIIDALAALHAHWWDHPGLVSVVGGRPTPQSVQHFFGWVEKTLPPFLDYLGDRLSSGRRALFDQALRAAPAFARRVLADRGITLAHGDAHFWNCLLPKHAETHRVRLVDWESWFVTLGATDVAYMLALHWYPERRARLEQPLVRRYHAQLLAHGVEGYDWQACWHDYRLAAVRNIFMPMSQWSASLSPAIWWGNLERAMLAFEDLGCGELI